MTTKVSNSEPRTQAGQPKWTYLVLIGLAAMLINIWAFTSTIPGVLAGHLTDPDSYMLLNRVFQEIQTHRLSDLVMRDESGIGVSIGWSHITDISVVVASLPFMPFLALKPALMAGGVLLALIMVGLLAAGISYAVAPLTKGRFLFLSPVLIHFLAGTRMYVIFGLVSHHIAFLAAVVWTAGHAIRSLKGQGHHELWTGVLGAISIAVTPETLPFVLLCYAFIAARWIENGESRPFLRLAGAAFLTDLFVTILDIPAHDLSQAWIDGPSIVYVALFAAILAGAACIYKFGYVLHSWRLRLSIFLVAAPVVLLLWAKLFHVFDGGLSAGVPPALAKNFYSGITEMAPLRGWVELSAYVGPGLIVTFICLFSYLKTRDWRYGVAGVVSIAACNLGIQHIRFVEWSSCFVALVIPVFAAQLADIFAGRPTWQAGTVIALVLGIVAVPLVPAFVKQGHMSKHLIEMASAHDSCSTDGLENLLAPYAGKIVLASVNYTPEILWRTEVITTGSLYSRGAWGFMRNESAWASPADATEPASFAQTGAQYVLYCPVRHAYVTIINNAEPTVLEALQDKQPPRWLSLVASDPISKFVLYKVANPPAFRIVRNY